MKIRSIEPIAISLPMKKPVKMAGETVSRADNILVRIESDNGVTGWGEAAAAPTMTGETVASMMTAVTHMAPGLLRRAAYARYPVPVRRYAGLGAPRAAGAGRTYRRNPQP